MLPQAKARICKEDADKNTFTWEKDVWIIYIEESFYFSRN